MTAGPVYRSLPALWGPQVAALLLLLAWAARGGVPSDYPARVKQLEESVAAHPADLEALDALASSYAMGAQYGKAAAMVERMVAVAGKRPEWELRLARLHAWEGKTGEAVRGFSAYLAVRPEDRGATLDLIRIREYRGNYGPAEALCNGWLRTHPNDAEVLALKAEVLHWAGNRRKLARRTAEQAVRLAPELPNARIAQIYALQDQGQMHQATQAFARLREQIEASGGIPKGAAYADAYHLIETTLGQQPKESVTPVTWLYDDSDAIHDMLAGVHLSLPAGDDWAFLADVNHYRSSAPAGSAFVLGRPVAERNEAAAGATWQASPEIRAQFSGGSSWRASGIGLQPTYDFHLIVEPADRWKVEFSSAREFLNVTPRAIDLDMASYKLDGRITCAPDPLTSLSAHVEQRYWSDRNRSIFADGLFRRTIWRHQRLKLDGLGETWWETFAFDSHMGSGFFTPVGYQRHDAGLGLRGEAGPKLVFDIRSVSGAQRISQGADYRLTWQATASAGVRLTRGLRLFANYERRNYTLRSQNGWYQGMYASLEIRRTGEKP
jgi:tetratricopeptide (TPR) repeat protein